MNALMTSDAEVLPFLNDQGDYGIKPGQYPVDLLNDASTWMSDGFAMGCILRDRLDAVDLKYESQALRTMCLLMEMAISNCEAVVHTIRESQRKVESG